MNNYFLLVSFAKNLPLEMVVWPERQLLKNYNETVLGKVSSLLQLPARSGYYDRQLIEQYNETMLGKVSSLLQLPVRSGYYDRQLMKKYNETTIIKNV